MSETNKLRAYSYVEVSELLGLSLPYVKTLVYRGTIKSMKTGKRRLIPAWAVEEFLAQAS